MFKLSKSGLWLAPLVALTSIPVCAAEEDPMLCGRNRAVCVQLEDKLETCLADRGHQLSTACRDQLKGAMAMMADPSGPAACIPMSNGFAPTKTESPGGLHVREAGEFLGGLPALPSTQPLRNPV